jgi:hypothetical protein
MSKFTQPEVKDVIHRAKMLNIPLEDYIERVVTTYNVWGTRGFGFVCKNFEEFEMRVFSSIKLMVYDDPADPVGGFMGSNVKKEGYAFSFRERNPNSSLHLELGNPLCDAHIDSHSVTPGSGADWGDYGSQRLLGHGWYDLLGSKLYEKKSLRKFAKKVSPIATHLKMDLTVKGRRIQSGDPNDDLMLDPVNGKENRFTLSVFWRF